MTVTLVLRGGRVATFADQDQVFSFEADDDGTLIHLSVPALAELHRSQPKKWCTIEIPITLDDAMMVKEKRGIDAIQAMRLPDRWLDEPGYGIFLSDGSFLIADGNHRFFGRHMRGDTGMILHASRFPHWQAAEIDIAATSALMLRTKMGSCQ